MRAKKILQVFLTCMFVAGSLGITAEAHTTMGEYAVRLEDMERELIGMAGLDVLSGNGTRATNSINSDIPANTAAVSDIKFSLEVDETVTINCSYSPASASMDFGVIAPDGYFYFLNVKGGSINQSITVDQRGSYSLAIRNNSSSSVRVVGFVNY